MINIDHLTKRYGSITAVDGLSFEVGPGRVTGFLGPNGAGKTTTLRILLGLAAPDSGTATINGARYRDLPNPAQTVGAALEADTFQPGRSAIEHLRILAIAAGIGRHRPAQAAQTVDDVVVINHGKLAAQGPVAELTAATSTTRIRTPDTDLLTSVLARQGITARLVAPGTVEVRGADPDRVARIAAAASVVVLELSRHTENLEELFFDLTTDRADGRVLEACPS